MDEKAPETGLSPFHAVNAALSVVCGDRSAPHPGFPEKVDAIGHPRLFTSWEMHRILIIALKTWKRLHPYLT
ncbi:hypothetical protein [Rhizobium sp. P44RR-XXIV]|uniref:hypothetical protein n=1 Tax=Rhizobium sp. P44RR-XXIV TaxID=1921145 RepID=UPI0010AB4B35|nr:hypothetical protein [Rhizobium sp. P44RR-XXIV]TIX91191.1 hypothetical protein BSK43_009400 [Rhizobium sp. P44RR-XXIV]